MTAPLTTVTVNGNAQRTRRGVGKKIVFIAALTAAPLLAGTYQNALLTEVLIFAVFAMSLDLLIGYTGLFTLGHAAFFGLGAYTVIVLNAHHGVSPWLGAVGGIAVATSAASAIGYLCVRVSGVPFLMLTLAFSQLVYSLAVSWRGVTGGHDGLRSAARPAFLGLSLSNPVTMYYVALVAFLVVFLMLRRLIGSPLGQVFAGIRENEARMRSIGYSTHAYKTLAFTIGGAVAGLSGAIYAFYNGFVSVDAFHWTLSGDVVIMVILGGVGTLVGPVVGAAVFLLMKNLVSSYTEHWLLIIGTVFVVSVMYFPKGIYGTLAEFAQRRDHDR
jgi:branched-chain amino acid transport system permease protein